MNIWPWLRRYQHLIVLTVVVSLVVWLPRVVGGRAGPTTNNATASLGGTTGAGADDPGGLSSGPTGSTSTGGANAAGSAAGGGGSGSAGGGASGSASISSSSAGQAGGRSQTTNATGPAGQYPGVGTAAALANPMCDPKTGKVRVPSIYAAPCVAGWPAGANNGGSTYAGVTATTIEIVAYFPAGSTSAPPTPAQQQQYDAEITNATRMFADHYELWGRRIHLDFFTGTGTDETSQNADAIQVLDQYHPFMVTTIGSIGGSGVPTFDTTIAAHGVIDFAANLSYQQAQAQAGFRYGYNPDDRLYAVELGEFIGKELAHRPAVWAGDAGFHAQPRKFGLIYDNFFSDQMGLFKQTLAEYGARLADAVSYDPTSDDSTLASDAATQIVRMKAEGINNIIAFTNPTYTALLTDDAASQSYDPEWTATGWAEQDTTLESNTFNQGEWSHAFGIGPVPPLQQPTTNTEYEAMYRWQTGANPPAGLDTALVGAFYLWAKSTTLGLQDAGPDLTPTTFRTAMFGAPPSGGRWCLPAPGCFTHEGMSFGLLSGYPGSKYVDNSDFALKWWNAQKSGTDEIGLPSTGVWEVLNGGERYSPGSFPTGQPDYFNLAGATDSYQNLPAADTPPNYPPPNRSAQPSVYH